MALVLAWSVGQGEKIGVVGGTCTESPFLRINNRLDKVFTAESAVDARPERIAMIIDPTLDRVAYRGPLWFVPTLVALLPLPSHREGRKLAL